MALVDDLLATMWSAVAGTTALPVPVKFRGERAAASAFAATDFAAASVAAAGLAMSELIAGTGGAAPAVVVDRELASGWFLSSLRPIGWEAPKVWHAIARYYKTADGWVLIHANNAHHREAALRALKCADDYETVKAAVRTWHGDDLEQAVLDEGGCIAALHTLEEWAEHPHGRAVMGEELLAKGATSDGSDRGWRPGGARPLEGLKVLDFTRILAGPIATRFLAGYGANVLRIDPPTWDEALIPEVTLGKRCARVDGKSPEGQQRLRELLADADVIVHGYRPGALDHIGLDAETRQALRPGIIDISLDAYGWTGPWAGRRGFDSLVQVSSGIADYGRDWAQTYEPKPLPYQALDHATGYLMAAVALRALLERATSGHGTTVRCSLARTGRLLVDEARVSVEDPPLDLRAVPLCDEIEETSWGPAQRVQVPLVVEGAPMHWTLPATRLGTSPASW